MPDQRTPFQRALDEHVGPPLYYCDDCKLAVKVIPIDGQEPLIERPCGKQCGHQIIAPRKCILAGEGGLNFKDKVTVAWQQMAAALTGRSV